MMKSNKAVYAMAIAPHPFDNDMGVGGAVAKWSREGKDVIYVICTNGDKATSDPAIKPEEFSVIRKQEQQAAAKILGVKETIFLGHPDLGLEYTAAFRKELLLLMLKYRPQIVITNDPYYRFRGYFTSIDHRITGQATMDAVWPYLLAPGTYRDLIDTGYQPHKVREMLMWQTDNVNFHIDITDTFDLKVAALRCHKSQTSSQPEGWEDRLKERCAEAAKGENYTLAEAFHREEVLQQL
jgi:LmbE family N-acetylglucosaminyl deacetylase